MQREMIRLNIEYGRGPFGTWSIQYRSPLAAIFVFCFSTILIVVVYVVLVVYLVFLISILFYHFIWCALLPE